MTDMNGVAPGKPLTALAVSVVSAGLSWMDQLSYWVDIIAGVVAIIAGLFSIAWAGYSIYDKYQKRKIKKN